MLEEFLERTVIASLGIKTWHLVFMIVAAGCILIIVICCIFRCRIPRTRQEIEADIVRTRVCVQFRKHLDKLPIDDMKLLNVMDKVKLMEEERLKEGIEDENYTIWQRVKLWVIKSNKESSEMASIDKQCSVEIVEETQAGDVNNNEDLEETKVIENEKKK